MSSERPAFRIIHRVAQHVDTLLAVVNKVL